MQLISHHIKQLFTFRTFLLFSFLYKLRIFTTLFLCKENPIKSPMTYYSAYKIVFDKNHNGMPHEKHTFGKGHCGTCVNIVKAYTLSSRLLCLQIIWTYADYTIVLFMMIKCCLELRTRWMRGRKEIIKRQLCGKGRKKLDGNCAITMEEESANKQQRI